MDEALSMWQLESLSESSLAPTTGVQVGESHVAGGWTAGAFLEFLSLSAISWPGSFSIVRLLTCWLRAPKVCVPRMSEPRFQGRKIDSASWRWSSALHCKKGRRDRISRAWSLLGSTTCHTHLCSFCQSLTSLLLVPSPFWWCLIILRSWPLPPCSANSFKI